MKVARKNTESYVLFYKFQLHATEGNTRHELTGIYKGAYKDCNNKKSYSQFPISWQAWAHRKLFGITLVKWLGGELHWDMLSKQGRQNRRWYNWPQQAPSLCSCLFSLTTPFVGVDESGLDQRRDTAENSKAICVTWLTSPFCFTEWLYREIREHTGNRHNYAGVEIGLTTRSMNACSDNLSFNTHVVKADKNLGPAVKDEEECGSGWLHCGNKRLKTDWEVSLSLRDTLHHN